ncbi:hypothetical protein AU476_16395 [Cupriavidus sp. UYMSc13B]|nr:hypothetical protein AU476_16395 [Cupriavidus sp. UYMSc13B]
MLCYVGIIWKDVLFATWMLSSFLLSIAAARAEKKCAVAILAILSIAFIALGPLIRQQGTLIAPIIAAAPLMTLWNIAPKQRPQNTLIAALVFVQ